MLRSSSGCRKRSRQKWITLSKINYYNYSTHHHSTTFIVVGIGGNAVLCCVAVAVCAVLPVMPICWQMGQPSFPSFVALLPCCCCCCCAMPCSLLSADSVELCCGRAMLCFLRRRRWCASSGCAGRAVRYGSAGLRRSIAHKKSPWTPRKASQGLVKDGRGITLFNEVAD